MGCYLSAPDDRVLVTEGKGKNFRYSTASCQGWRKEQEDAEDCIPFFDDDASLFILCDGHGGAEVAKYTVGHFPDFLKNHNDYKNGNYEKALEEAFLEFDKRLRSPEVLIELENIAMNAEVAAALKNVVGGDDVLEDSDKDPHDNLGPHLISHKVTQEDNPSTGSSTSDAPTSSSAGGNSSGSGPSAGPSTSSGSSSTNGPASVAEDVDSETLRREAHIPIEELISKYAGPSHIKGRVQSLRHGSLKISGSPVIRSSQREDEDGDCDSLEKKSAIDGGGPSSGGDNDQPGPSKPTSDGTPLSSGSKPELEIIKKAMEQYFKEGDDDDDDDDSEFDISEMESDDEGEDEEEDGSEEDGEGFNEDEELGLEDSASCSDDDGDDEREDENATSEKSKSKRLRKKHRRRSMEHSSSSESEADDSDEEDEDEDSEDEDDDDQDAKSNFLSSRKLIAKQIKAASRIHKPGMDSGCTVVVALVKAGTLYVASAGDSRCIVIMKDGRYKAMSFDHKPEDEAEIKRIEEANGTVVEGRVNGGLNLSRAFGDFNYKDSDLDQRKQMITALPDVKSLKIDFSEVEFIFLACDGIWNSMNNAKVAKFIHFCRHSKNYSLVDTCMALFRNCLAPSTDGDGTGCDNMTCILVKYYSDGESMEDSQITEQKDLKTTLKATENDTPDQHTENNNQKINDVNDKKAISSTGKRSADFGDDLDAKKTFKRRCLRLLE